MPRFKENRCFSSKAYRVLSHPLARRIGIACFVAGWALNAFAVSAVSAGVVPDDTAAHLSFAAQQGGLMLIGIAVMGFVARFVSKPAAREMVAEHVRELHIDQEKDQAKSHEIVIRSIGKLEVQITKMNGILNTRLALLSCQRAQDGGKSCPGLPGSESELDERETG